MAASATTAPAMKELTGVRESERESEGGSEFNKRENAGWRGSFVFWVSRERQKGGGGGGKGAAKVCFNETRYLFAHTHARAHTHTRAGYAWILMRRMSIGASTLGQKTTR